MSEMHRPHFETHRLTSQGGWGAYAKLSALKEADLWPFMQEVALEARSYGVPVTFTARVGTIGMSHEDKELFEEEFIDTDQLRFEDITELGVQSFLNMELAYNTHSGRFVDEGKNVFVRDAQDVIGVNVLPKGNIVLFHDVRVPQAGKTIKTEAICFKSNNPYSSEEGPAHTAFLKLLHANSPLPPVEPVVFKFRHLTVLE